MHMDGGLAPGHGWEGQQGRGNHHQPLGSLRPHPTRYKHKANGQVSPAGRKWSSSDLKGAHKAGKDPGPLGTHGLEDLAICQPDMVVMSAFYIMTSRLILSGKPMTL